MSERTEYQQHMDAMAKRVSDVLHGEKLADIVSVCGAIIAYSLSEIPDREQRKQARDGVIKLIKKFSMHNYPGQHP